MYVYVQYMHYALYHVFIQNNIAGHGTVNLLRFHLVQYTYFVIVVLIRLGVS